MSLIQHIDHIARQPGVLSIIVDFPVEHGEQRAEAFRGAPAWKQTLADTIPMHRHAAAASITDDDSIRVTVGAHTIYVQREAGQVAAIVVPTGHAIRKSLRRMIRRCARPEGRKSDRAAAVDAVILAEDAEVLDAAAAFGV